MELWIKVIATIAVFAIAGWVGYELTNAPLDPNNENTKRKTNNHGI